MHGKSVSSHNFCIDTLFYLLFTQTPLQLAMVILAAERDSFISQTLSVMEQRTHSLTVEPLLWGSTSVTIMKMQGSFVKV